MHHKSQRKNDGSEEFDSPTKDDLLPEKLQRPEDPLAEALKFLQPLQQLSAKDLSTHLFAFEIYYRKGRLLTKQQGLFKIQAICSFEIYFLLKTSQGYASFYFHVWGYVFVKPHIQCHVNK